MKRKKVKALLAATMTGIMLSGYPLMTFASSEEAAEEISEAEEAEDTEDSDDTNTESTAKGGEKAPENMEDKTFGRVTAISGNQITVELGAMKTDGRPGDNGENPEKPEGEEGEAPEKPEGEEGEAPDMPEGEGAPEGMDGFTPEGEELTLEITEDTRIIRQEKDNETEITIDDLKEGDILMIEMEGDVVKTLTLSNMRGGPGEESGPGTGGDMAGASEGSTALTGVFAADGEEKTSENETYESTASDESAVLVQNGGKVTMTGASLTKSGDTSDVDQSNFYALNAGVAVRKGSEAELTDTVIDTNAEGANAVFATGEDAVIRADNIKIHTTGDSSRGLDATYGGTVEGTNVDITTEGAHCAPLATDRGEGTIAVTGGTLSAAGDGSPCIYSTGNITATDVTGTATGSQTLVVEGKNSITLENCDLTGAGENGLMLYQSTSGDAGEGTAVLTVRDSTLTTTSGGPMFYITNTDAEADFTNTALNYESGTLVQVSGNNTNNWGKEGENGGDFRLTGSSQTFAGDIVCDEISTIEVNLTDNSTLEGAVDAEDTAKSASVSLDGTSVWNVTGDSHVTVLKNETEDNSNIVSNGYTIYYDAANEDNAWLNGETITLSDGGTIQPEE